MNQYDFDVRRTYEDIRRKCSTEDGAKETTQVFPCIPVIFAHPITPPGEYLKDECVVMLSGFLQCEKSTAPVENGEPEVQSW
jgi:hypothetical protein